MRAHIFKGGPGSPFGVLGASHMMNQVHAAADCGIRIAAVIRIRLHPEPVPPCLTRLR
jgi:hypothetical protein